MAIIMQARQLGLRAIASFVAGAILVAAFAPIGFAGLAFLCVAVLFYICRDLTPRQAFLMGLAFGYGLFGFGVSWVYVSLNVYGGMPIWMGSIAVLLFAGILAIFIGFTTYFAARLCPQGGVKRILMLAPLWVVFEWIKSWIFTGFAWMELGVSQTPSWFFGFAPFGGVYLVSFMVAISASCLVLLFRYPGKLWSGGVLVCVILGSALADQVSWTKAVGQPVNVGIVQANVPINQKWRPQYRERVIAKLRSMSEFIVEQESSKQTPVDLLVWPETALPLFYQETDPKFWQDLIPSNTALLTGIVDYPNSDHNYNAAVLNCDSQQQLYRKRHLVPFGEYLPMKFLFSWLLEYLQLPMDDLDAWQGEQSLNCENSVKIGLSICYEDAFASEIRRYSGDATLLINISEDAWFGDSFAPHQRLQMGQMRARELSRPMARSANSGPSSMIDHRGRVLVKTAQFEEATLAYALQPQTGDTAFKRFGHWIVWLCLGLLVLVFIRNQGRSKE
ncbi:MAG: apolipoprotein N-acyltransferase [Arenicella sp.]|jgi:apolipoprotein N-acyltransferase